MNLELIQCLKEIGEFNILIDTLTEHEKQPNNIKIKQIVLDNLTLAHHSVKIVNKERHIPNKCQLNSILEAKFYAENYFRRNGYENNVSKKLGLMYKETLSLIKRITTDKVKVDLTRLNDNEANLLINKYPNLTYGYYLNKYKTAIMNKVSKGKEPKLTSIKGHAPIDEIKRLALTDARNWSFNGNDTYRDLRREFGSETMGELLDMDMLLACNKLLEKQEQEHLRALRLDQEETLSDFDRIVQEIIDDCESRRPIS